MDEIKGYRERVREAISLRNGVPILNGSINHAGIIVAEAFLAAHHKVCLLSHRLDQGCYDESVRNAAAYFLADPDHKARILIESSIDDENNNYQWNKHPFIKAFEDYLKEGDRLEIRIVPENWVRRYSFNFLILDDYGFRFEADRAKAAAVAAFYPPPKEGEVIEDVEHLQSIFDQLWDKSVKLTLQ